MTVLYFFLLDLLVNATMTSDKNKQFSHDESDLLHHIMTARRDVRGNRFLPTQIPQDKLDKILEAALCAPSVGFSQPWEFVIITDNQVRQSIANSFYVENEKATKLFDGDKSKKYQQLKLEGILQSPLNIAVLYNPQKGPVLGQTSMPDMGRFSVVCAVQNMWLMARSLNIGMGWVSILDPECVKKAIRAPQDRELIAYLCVGYVDKFYDKPELETLSWEKRKKTEQVILNNNY